jgi:hypothetical protein
MSPLSHPSFLSRILRRLPAVAAAVCALGLVQAGSALADYDAGHFAHGNLICGVSHSNGAYSIYATAPVVIPDVPNHWVAFHDELWNDSGGTWHVVSALPWEYKQAPSDIFSAGLTDQFATYSWQTQSGAWTSGTHSWTVTPGTRARPRAGCTATGASTSENVSKRAYASRAARPPAGRSLR